MHKCGYLSNRSRFYKGEIKEGIKKRQSYDVQNERAHKSLLKNQKQNMDNTDNIEIPSHSSIRYSIQRLKTGKLQRSQIMNRKMAKNTLRKMRRMNTIQKNSQYEKHISSLKHHVNRLNAACNQVIKSQRKKQHVTQNSQQINNYVKDERKKFLMQQISFTQIDEQKIQYQRKFLGKFSHLTQSLPKMIQTHLSGKQELKKREETIMECLRSIEKIYFFMKQMQSVGFPQKSNKFMIEYCKNGRVWLRRIFLSQYKDKKQNFSIAVKYVVIQTAEQAKKKFSQFLAKPFNQNFQTIRKQISQLVQHLQHSLTEIKIANLMNVTQQIDSHLQKYGKNFHMPFEKEFTIMKGSRLRLTQDLQRMQSEFGQMHCIAKVSRRKYEQLNNTYDKLQSYF